MCVLLQNDTLKRSVLVKLDCWQFPVRLSFGREPCHFLAKGALFKEVGQSRAGGAWSSAALERVSYVHVAL